jgi:hypothetical protein
MGTNNRQRRAAKRRKQAGQRARPSATTWRPQQSPSQEPSPPRSPGPSSDELEQTLHRLLDGVWRGGWRPVELVREIRRSSRGTDVVELLRTLIAVDHARRPVESFHPRWRQQIDAIDLPTTGSAPGWLTEVVRDRATAVSGVQDLMTLLAGLTRLPRLVPPPGGAPTDVDIGLGGSAGHPCVPGGHDAADTDQSGAVLERVRALLAKAESTQYTAEAEAFTAKAHELMTRHAIDATLVAGGALRAGWVTAVRIPVDEPYLDSKAQLLHSIARHSRCRSVSHSAYAMTTVLGASTDLAGVELLFTSLLLQGQQALLAEGASALPGARERSRGFRSSFLMAYALRIDERLEAVSTEVVADASRAAQASGVEVLPVLAARSAEVDAEVDRLFGGLTRARLRSRSDAAGWASGRRAADRANLGGSDLEGGSAGVLAS